MQDIFGSVECLDGFSYNVVCISVSQFLCYSFDINTSLAPKIGFRDFFRSTLLQSSESPFEDLFNSQF